MSEKLVLLVEDNEDDVELARRAFGNHAGEAAMAVVRDGAEALGWLLGRGPHKAREPGRMPAVVLLDLRLPKLDGFEVLERLRGNARTELVPVVIVSSSAEESDRRRAYELGANGFVQKPVESRAFDRAIARLSEYWLRLNEPPPQG